MRTGIRYAPRVSVTPWNVFPDASCSAVTATPGSTPPVESVTVPLTVASCAYAGTASASIPTITISRLTTRQRNKVNMRASSRKEQEGERRRRSEIAWHNCAIAVPILDDPIPVLQEPEKTAVRTVPEAMAPYFDAVARLEIAGGDANSLERRTPGGFERPQLRLAFGILDFHVDPGMRDNVVHFPDDTFDVHERVGVGAVRMVGPCGKRDAKRTHRCGNQCEPHVQPPHRARKGFVRSAALIRLARRRAGGVNPTLTGLNRPVHARRCRHSIDEDRLVDVDELIAQPDPALVEPSERLLKQARLRVPRRHGCLGDIELVPVHVDPCERTGLVGVVGELQLMAFDHVDGHQLQLTNNADKSRTFAGIYMHGNKLYITEATVPAGYPEPGLFQQSLGWLDESGIGLRYQFVYINEAIFINGVPAPPRVDRTIQPGQGRIDAPGATPGQ